MNLEERVARLLATQDGRDPDALEPGNTPGGMYNDETIIVDGKTRGENAFYTWRMYVHPAREILRLIKEHEI